MNDLLFYALIMALLIYFLVYLPRQKRLEVVKTTALASTQTDLTDKQITNLIQQWEQVAEWAKEEGIDVNKKWNLNLLKTQLTNQIKDLKDQLSREPIQVKYSRGTQTNPEPDLTNTLDNLIKDIQDFNNQIK